MKISILIPCFNEENFIKKTITNVFENIDPFEILVIDDGSTDDSVKIVDEIDNPKLKFIKNDKNLGKGYCLQRGFTAATGDLVIVQDADPEYNPQDLKVIIEPFGNQSADFVIGTRFHTKNKRKIGYFYHTVFNKLITFFVNLKSNTNFTDIECGYKAVSKEILQKIDLKEKRFGIEVELIRKLSKLNLNMYEVPVSYEMRSYNEGKKIGLKDAFSAIYCLIKY